MTIKTCNTCEKTKNLDEFPRDAQKKDGRRNQCSLCRNSGLRAAYPAKYRKRKHVVVDGEKECGRCGLVKSVEDFYTSSKVRCGYSYDCRQCISEKKSSQGTLWRTRKYGIDRERFFEMLKSQDGKCKICKDAIDEGAFIDHCHATLKVRGLLCRHCNTGLGFFRDNPEYLAAAIQYLTDHQ